jgi:hypothetical protein
VGVTGFSVVGDQTALYTTGRRVKATVTGGDRFGIVTSAVLATGSTAVGVTLDSGTLNGGLSVISYGILSTPNGSVPWETQTSTGISSYGVLNFLNVAHNDAQTTVTSSANPNIWIGGNVIDFTGTTTVSSFATAPQAGATRTLLIDGSTTVTFSTSSVLRIAGGVSSYVATIGEKIDVFATSATFFSVYPSSPISYGTWTPSVGGSATYSNQSGLWAKIGKLVYIQIGLQINAIGTGSQTAISGLPFASAGNGRIIPVNWTLISTTAVAVVGQINGSIMTLVSAINASTSLAANAIVTSGTGINASGVYDTTA